MPLLKISSNLDLSEDKKINFSKVASSFLAKELGKPESYVMILFNSTCTMIFGGHDAPCLYGELKSIGRMDEESCRRLAKSLCQFINKELQISGDRVYIEFTDIPPGMWGFNSKTFA